MLRNYCLGFGALLVLTGCQSGSARLPEDHAPEPTSITKWTTKTELFADFAPLVVGKATPLAVHLTDLETSRPVSQDVVMTTLEGRDGRQLTVHSETPISPGIYRPVLRPTEPGTYRLRFTRSHPDTRTVRDTIDAGEVAVVATETDRVRPAREPTGDGIPFLKEQQWQIALATQAVTTRELHPTLQLHAEVKPAAGGEVHITVPIMGRAVAVEKGVPTPGQRVEPGEPLARLLPFPAKSRADIVYAVRASQSELEAARHELARVQALYADRIVPRRRLEQAQKNVAVLTARLSAARAELSLLDVNPAGAATSPPPRAQRFLLRAPMAGTVVAANFTPERWSKRAITCSPL